MTREPTARVQKLNLENVKRTQWWKVLNHSFVWRAKILSSTRRTSVCVCVWVCVTPSVHLCVSPVCTAASLQQPNQELCQSSGQHGRRGKSLLFAGLRRRAHKPTSHLPVCVCVCLRVYVHVWHPNLDLCLCLPSFTESVRSTGVTQESATLMMEGCFSPSSLFSLLHLLPLFGPDLQGTAEHEDRSCCHGDLDL